MVDAAAAPPSAGTPRPKKRKRVYVERPLLNQTLTASYLVLCVLCVVFWLIESTMALVEFAVVLVATAAAAYIVKSMWRSFGAAVSRNWLSGPPFYDPMRKPAALKDFTEQSWQLAIHVAMTAAEISVLIDEDWLWWKDPRSYWMPAPEHQSISPKLRLVYMTQLAIWIFTCFSHRFVEKRRADYFVMFGHHVVTIILVAGAYHFKYHRCGFMVLFIHDASDVLVDALKMFNYMKLQGREGFFLCEIFMSFHLIAWGFLRLYMFPFRILPSQSSPGSGYTLPTPLKILEASAWILVLMHAWWYYLFLRILWKTIRGTDVHSAGTEYEGNSDEDPKDE